MVKRNAEANSAECLLIIIITWLLAVFILKMLENSEMVLLAAAGITAVVLFSWAAPMKFQAAAREFDS